MMIIIWNGLDLNKEKKIDWKNFHNYVSPIYLFIKSSNFVEKIRKIFNKVNSTIGYNWTSVSLSASGQYQTATISGVSGGVYKSTDFGQSFSKITNGFNNYVDGTNYKSASISASGKYQIVVSLNKLFVSS